METIEQVQSADRPEGRKQVDVTVNGHLITFDEHKATGLEIKQAAIAQGVAIQQDFALFEAKGAGQLKAIGDADVVSLHPNQEFRAVAPDDNS